MSTYHRQNLRKNCAQDIHCTFQHTSPKSDILIILNTNIQVIMYLHVFFQCISFFFTFFPNFSPSHTNILVSQCTISKRKTHG